VRPVIRWVGLIFFFFGLIFERWFSSFFFFWFSLFLPFFKAHLYSSAASSFVPTNRLTPRIPIADLPPPKLLEQPQIGTHPTMARTIQIYPLKAPTSPTARCRRHLSFMRKDPTSLPEDRSESPTFFSGGRSPKAGYPEEEVEGVGDGHPSPHVLGYGLVGRWRYSAQQQQQNGGARTYALQFISSPVLNPSASGPRMHDYTIRAGAAAIQVPLERGSLRFSRSF
jgi:hypothetical protein